MRDADLERRRHALEAARKIAARYGVDSDRATILKDSNHTVIHLAPAPIVAKVGTSPEEASLADEVRIARFLAERDAPVVPPASIFPPGPHVEDGLEVTFWEYCPHSPEEPSPDAHASCMRVLHDALHEYTEPLRPWDGFDGVGRVLENPAALTALSFDDRAFLKHRYAELLSQISTFHPPVRPLHGEPHSANLLMSSAAPRWIDFESVCTGPVEWDLTVLPEEVVARSFEEVDWELLRVLRQMRSLCVAVWCWLDPDRAPVLREAGMLHLSLLKDRTDR